MDLKQIIDAERVGNRAVGHARVWVNDSGAEAGTLAALNHLDFILAEVRHFAVCFDQNRSLEAAGHVGDIEARADRELIVQRLVAAFVPSRL